MTPPLPTLSPLHSVRGCQDSLRRCLALLDCLDDARYAARDGGHSSIGAHMRHCIEHFQAFETGWSSGRIEYDARARDERLEGAIGPVREELYAALAMLECVGAADLPRAVCVSTAPAPGAPPQPLASSIERELAFLSSHTIHHLALMVILARAAGARVPEDLGLAYSTAAHMASAKASGACAR